MTQNRLIEYLKTVILVVLFLTTILLLYLLWGQSLAPGIVGIFEPGASAQSISAKDYIEPLYVAYGNGDGSFVLAENTESDFQSSIAGFAAYNSGEAMLTEISKDTFDEVVEKYKSRMVSFGYNLPFEEFCELFGIGRVLGAESVAYLESFAFSEASKESVFVKDEYNEKYYRLLFAEGHDIPNIPQTGPESLCYGAGDILGGSSHALISLAPTGNLAELSCSFDAEGSASRRDLAEDIFGDTLDFVRRITDSFGNITYMYGYGQESLTANVDGSYEYKTEGSNLESLGFFKELDSALSFAAVFGGLEDEFVLNNVIRTGSAKSASYTFEFVQKVCGVRVFSDHGPALSIETKGGQVLNASRRIISAQSASGETVAAAEPANVLANNCNHIYNISTNSMLAVDSAQAYSYVADNVRFVQKAYFTLEQGDLLMPCWLVGTDTALFFFDLYDASPLGFNRL